MRRILFAALIATALLGAGCRRAAPAAPSKSAAVPVAVSQAPHADPLADDLDGAVEDLKAVE